MATRTKARRVSYADVQLTGLMLSQNHHLPFPTSVTVEDAGVTLTVDTENDVDAWAEEMGVDTEHERHADGTWTDRAEGTVTVHPTRLSRGVIVEEKIRVTVYSPRLGPYVQNELVA